jgi:hypothetical protein
MDLAGYLANEKTFGRLLDQLASPTPDPQLLGDTALREAPSLRAFSALPWASSRRGTDEEPAQTLVLFVALQTGIYIDWVRRGYKPHILGGALLFLARSVWPAYGVWVADCHPPPVRWSVPSCIDWLRGEGTLVRVLRELQVSNPDADEFCRAANCFTRTDSAHQSWYARARKEVHAMVIKALGPLQGGEAGPPAERRYPSATPGDGGRADRVREAPVWPAGGAPA